MSAYIQQKIEACDLRVVELYNEGHHIKAILCKFSNALRKANVIIRDTLFSMMDNLDKLIAKACLKAYAAGFLYLAFAVLNKFGITDYAVNLLQYLIR